MKLRATSFLNFCDLYQYQGYTFFDTTEFPDFPESDTDTYVEVDSQYMGRLDLLSYDQYGDVELWWVIALVNGINTIEDMRIGQRLRVPSIADVKRFLAKSQA